MEKTITQTLEGGQDLNEPENPPLDTKVSCVHGQSWALWDHDRKTTPPAVRDGGHPDENKTQTQAKISKEEKKQQRNTQKMGAENWMKS